MSSTTAPVDHALPRWTTRSYGNEGGRDHLGLAGVITGQVLPALSPRVVAVTVHPRYWSFYTWLLWEFWESDLPKTSTAWSHFERTHESLFSIGAAGGLCGSPMHATVDGGIVGSNTTTTIARSGGPYTLPVDFLSNSTGGYGAQYAGVVNGAGLTISSFDDDRLDVDAPTEAGAALARDFRRAVADSNYVSQHLHAKTPITCSHDAAVEFMGRACICQLRTDAGVERARLRQALLHDDGESDDGNRQLATFRLYVELARQTDGTAVDEQTFRELVYFRHSHTVGFVPPTTLTHVARHWRLYQLRQYLSFALDRLWQWTVEWAREQRGETVAIRDITTAAAGALNDHTPDGASGLSAWTTAALAGAGTTAAAQAPDGPWPRTAADEQALQDRASELGWGDPAAAPLCLQLLALLMGRLEGWPDGGIDRQLQMAGGADRASIATVSAAWHDWADRGLSADIAIGELLRRFVIDQHVRIAYSKLPRIDSLRFSREGLRLRIHDQDASIAVGGARFAANSTVVHELGYTGPFHQPSHAPTDDGIALLTQEQSPT